MKDAKLPLPGMAAISLWMLGLALVGVVGVLTGRYSSGGSQDSRSGPVQCICTWQGSD